MKNTMLIGAVAVGAIVGSVATIAMIPCCTDAHNKKKLMRHKNQFFRTIGSVMDTMADFKR